MDKFYKTGLPLSRLALCVLLVNVLAGCRNLLPEETAETTKTTVTPRLTPTSFGPLTQLPTSTLPSSTTSPNLGLTQTPGTALPVIISSDNVSGLTTLAQWTVSAFFDVAWAPDSTEFAIADGDAVYLYDTKSFNQRLFGEALLSFVSIAFSPDGQIVASTGHGVQLWDYTNGHLIREMVGAPGCYSGNRIAFSPDGHTVVAGYSEKASKSSPSMTSIYQWDVETGACLGKLVTHEGQLFSLTFSSDGRLLITATDGNIYVWDVSTKAQICRFQSLYFAALIPNGKTLAIQDSNGISLKDTTTCQSLRTLEGSPYLQSLAFSPSGQLLVSGSVEISDLTNHVQIWDMDTGKLLHELRDLPNEPVALAFSPDGRFLVLVLRRAGTTDPATVSLWGVKP